MAEKFALIFYQEGIEFMITEYCRGYEVSIAGMDFKYFYQEERKKIYNTSNTNNLENPQQDINGFESQNITASFINTYNNYFNNSNSNGNAVNLDFDQTMSKLLFLVKTIIFFSSENTINL